MRSIRQDRDSIIYEHAKRIEELESNVLDLVRNSISKTEDTKVKGGVSISGIVDAMFGVHRKKRSPMSGKDILESEKDLLEYAEKARDSMAADPAYKMQLKDLNADIKRYRNELDRIEVELSKTSDEQKRKLLEEKYTLIESKK